MTILTCLGDSITDCDHCFSRDFLGNGYVKCCQTVLKGRLRLSGTQLWH